MKTMVYTRDHEWLEFSDSEVVIGITQHAQEQLGDVVFVELPEVGDELMQGEEAVVIESVKAAGEIAAPLTGTVVAVNESLVDAPELLNSDPEVEGWILKLASTGDVEMSDFMDQSQYQEFIRNGE